MTLAFSAPLFHMSLIPQVFPLRSLPKKQPTLLVVCGSEQNGAIGLACARHLRVFVGTPCVFTRLNIFFSGLIMNAAALYNSFMYHGN